VNYGGVATHNSPHRVFVSEPANAAKVHIFGPGVEKGVKCNTQTHFNIDCRDAGQGIVHYMKRSWLICGFGTDIIIPFSGLFCGAVSISV
jgi:hypothetical protein